MGNRRLQRAGGSVTGDNSLRAGLSSTVMAFIEMTKPRIIELLLITTIPAMAVAADGWPGWKLVALVLIGGTLSAGGANVINQVYDADIDRVMRRTESRPIPTGRVSQLSALIFGLTLGAFGFAVLAWGSTLLAAMLSLVAFVFYVVTYTMQLKRSTTQNIVLGGAAGAVPALIGWAAVTGDLTLQAWLMFAMIFYWTPPHFWALSIKYQDDYRSAGIPMLSVIAGERITFQEIGWYSIITVGVSLLLVPVAQLGWIYAATALVLGSWMVVASQRLKSDRKRAMPFFGFTNLYLAGVFLAMLVDRVAGVPPIKGGTGLWVGIGAIAIGLGSIGVFVSEATPETRAPGVARGRQILEVAAGISPGFVLLVAAWAAVIS